MKRSRLLALAFGLALLGGVEVALRLAGAAAGEAWAPPRLVQVVEQGEVKGELQVPARHFAEEAQPDGPTVIRTAAGFRDGTAPGRPYSGNMRDLRFSPEPTPG